MDQSQSEQPSEFEPSTYGHSFADVYDSWYPDNPDTAATVEFLLALAPASSSADERPLAIELGVGTGRLALPLVRRGLRVRGLDSSPEMLAQLQDKPEGNLVEVLMGDMAATPLGEPGEADLVFVAFNTLFNVTTADAQQACFHHVASVLKPGAPFLVEAFVPPSPDLLPSTGLSTRTVGFDCVVLTSTETNRESQTITGQHIEITEAGTRLRPWRLRYCSVAELDAMATKAGLELDGRVSDWNASPFDQHSTAHVSTYRKS